MLLEVVLTNLPLLQVLPLMGHASWTLSQVLVWPPPEVGGDRSLVERCVIQAALVLGLKLGQEKVLAMLLLTPQREVDSVLQRHG
jgi:hypothetical protein